MQTFDNISFYDDILRYHETIKIETKIDLMGTDHITVAILLYLFYNGWRKGFFKILLGPISLLIGCIGGFLYYQKTHNISTSLLICFFSPFVINFFASIILKFWHKAVNNNTSLPIFSRLLGSITSILWGGSYFVILYVMIAVVPLRLEWFEKIQTDVTSSKSYAFIDRWIMDKIPGASFDIKKVTNLLEDPSKLEKFESTEEFKALMEDERLEDIFSDEITAEQIQNKNYSQLLSNPKIQAIFQDEELLKKVFALNQKIMKEGLKESPGK